MNKLHVGFAISLLAACPLTALAQGSDDCSTAEPISGYGTFVFDTTFATSNPVALGCGAGDAANDVWFCWTALETGEAFVHLCNGDIFHDTLIAAYAGCECPSPNSEITCNDDSCGLQSRISFPVKAGQSYLIRIGAYSEGSVGPGSFTIHSRVIHTAKYKGHTYLLFSANNWNSAEEFAVSRGGHLVTINDQAESDFVWLNVLGFDGQDRRAWIGLNDAASEGNFEWTSGEPVTFTNWNPGEPNDFGGNEDYTEMFGGNGQWNDQPDHGNGFVQFGIAEIADSCAADFNDDGAVNSQDFFDFLTAFFADDPSADFNGDNLINSQDFFDFLTAFFEGCK